MIRKTLTHAFEGDDYHDLCVFLAERLYKARKPNVDLWSPDRRDVFRGYEEWPGLPDMVVTLSDGRERRTYVIEFENHLTDTKTILKKRQFKRYGIKDVIIIPINRFEHHENWMRVTEQIDEWLP